MIIEEGNPGLQRPLIYVPILLIPTIPPEITMKVTIKEWNAVATWRWDMPDDEVCGICRVQFDGTCPTCKFPGDDCSLRRDPRTMYGNILT